MASNKNIRVRFAPSPTGALHIGGVRTALYNYLLAKKYGGTFILRIEDTDQTRYVEGAEKYIMEALNWCGLKPDEGPGIGGDYGPYRQSERKAIYKDYAFNLLDSGKAYYAFDTTEELDQKREAEKEKGNHAFKYDNHTRMEMRNSLTLPKEEVDQLLSKGVGYTIRLKVPKDEIIEVKDLIRGTVSFNSNELDDKILLKADGMPTYHLANIVDDHSMKITHVIRGEEWLPSTAHHVLLYRFLGWEAEMPQFAHLPLILKPNGKGKLSKRDGNKLGIPVFPLSWEGDKPEDSFQGFREFGFDPNAVVNFLAFLGWNPGTEQEIFSIAELSEAFSIENIGKAGARFDFDKAKWFNQQYILSDSVDHLREVLEPKLEEKGYEVSKPFLSGFVELMRERVILYPDFLNNGSYFFEQVKEYDQKMVKKKWKPENRKSFELLLNDLQNSNSFSSDSIKSIVEGFMGQHNLKFGDVLPVLRLAVSGTTKGPSIFDTMALIGQDETITRMKLGYDYFDELKLPVN